MILDRSKKICECLSVTPINEGAQAAKLVQSVEAALVKYGNPEVLGILRGIKPIVTKSSDKAEIKREFSKLADALAGNKDTAQLGNMLKDALEKRDLVIAESASQYAVGILSVVLEGLSK
jgi:hypothetical protein